MSDIAIRVEGLSKAYRIGKVVESYRTLRETVIDMGLAPWRRAGKLLRGEASGASELDETLWALRDISFEVKQGEVIGLIGWNGAGKSTLLKILSRITEPTTGSAEIRGRVGSLLEVGTGFHPELTGRENIYLSGAILGMRRVEIDKRFDEIVAFAEVERFVDTPVKHYSSGMYLRLAFAVAAHLEPEILLVDEVLAVGDAAFQKKCLGKMDNVAQSGRTVLFVSHNMGAISSLCQRSVCLQQGQIVDIGDTASVLTSYVSRLNANLPDNGFADIRDLPRLTDIKDPQGQFEWVQILTVNKEQKATFLEHEPIVIEAGLALRKPARSLQFGCSVSRLNPPMELFTVPSEEYQEEFPCGTYTARLRLDPNYLREGLYTLALKLFIDGIRQDTVAETIQLSIIQYIPEGENSAHCAPWVAGPLRMPYEWQPEITQQEEYTLSAVSVSKTSPA